MKLELGLILSIICVIIACEKSTGRRNIKSYYFPLDQLLEGRIYEYHPVNNDTLPVEYWYFRTHDLDSGRIFTGNFYDEHFVVQQFFTEEIVSNGTLMKDYFLYATDTSGRQIRVPTEILVPNVFPFEVSDSGGIFLFKMSWKTSQDPLITTTLIRNRRYTGDTSYTFQGKMYDCVRFQLNEVYDIHVVGEGHSEPESQGIELYAKDIGLIYYKKVISETVTLEYELADIYTMTDFEKKFNHEE